MNNKMLQSFQLFAVLMALWLLMSGIFTPLLIGLGLISTLAVVGIARRMQLFNNDPSGTVLGPTSLISYLFWLVVMVLKADWAVLKVIFSRKMRLKQRLIRVSATQNSDIGKVVFANSITLTPGTITVETEGNHFLVHALNDEAADLVGLKEMDARVTALEVGGKF